MKKALPPLDHLRAFEAAARHLSFKKAAEEMNVTPAAIGQRIRSLESILRSQLFDRKIRHVTLTIEGQLLLRDVAAGIELIDLGISRHWARKQSDVLKITTTHSFAELELLPKLPEFKAEFPDLNVRLITTDEKLDPDKFETDICIRFGMPPVTGCRTVPLAKQFYIPVCSPAIISKDPRELQVADILTMPLIEEEWDVASDAAPSWKVWVHKRGLSWKPKGSITKVSLESHAVRAAVTGHGVALVRVSSVIDLIENKTLVELFGPTGREYSKFDYHLIWRNGDVSAAERQFLNWIIGHFGDEKIEAKYAQEMN
ncbi:MAG: LysR substrate-binding domain-containing protein [Alphaproteobacteria bacterium]|nr:LysR substrate-binding domain-containing protein [Alphaproteobacteria bacterium]